VVNIDTQEQTDLMGRAVLFTLEDAGGKSIEARNVRLADESVARSVLGGRIVAWNVVVGRGWVEVEQTELRLGFTGAELEVDRRLQTEALVDRRVLFELHVDRNFGVEARSVQLVKDDHYNCSTVPDLSLPHFSASAEPSQSSHSRFDRTVTMSHYSPDRKGTAPYSPRVIYPSISPKRSLFRRSPTYKPRSTSRSLLCRLGPKVPVRARLGFRKTELYLSSSGEYYDDYTNNNYSDDQEVFTTVDQVGYTEVSSKEIKVKQGNDSVDLDKIVIKRRV